MAFGETQMTQITQINKMRIHVLNLRHLRHLRFAEGPPESVVVTEVRHSSGQGPGRGLAVNLSRLALDTSHGSTVANAVTFTGGSSFTLVAISRTAL